MFAWRRIIACLLIMVFAPVSMLAAMPLRICAERDGGQAIEFDIVPCFSAGAERAAKEALPSSFDAGQFDQFTIQSSCHDTQLLPATGKPASEASFKKKTDSSKTLGSGLAVAPQAPEAISYCRTQTSSQVAVAGNRRHPSLAFLATVVLRL